MSLLPSYVITILNMLLNSNTYDKNLIAYMFLSWHRTSNTRGMFLWKSWLKDKLGKRGLLQKMDQ